MHTGGSGPSRAGRPTPTGQAAALETSGVLTSPERRSHESGRHRTDVGRSTPPTAGPSRPRFAPPSIGRLGLHASPPAPTGSVEPDPTAMVAAELAYAAVLTVLAQQAPGVLVLTWDSGASRRRRRVGRQRGRHAAPLLVCRARCPWTTTPNVGFVMIHTTVPPSASTCQPSGRMGRHPTSAPDRVPAHHSAATAAPGR
jgi:hypothetical protein